MLSVEIREESYRLIDPKSISRRVLHRSANLSQAFSLPEFSSDPVRGEGFVGDTTQGGSCNVKVLSFTPHNLTHIETPQHAVTGGTHLADLPVTIFQGIACLLNLSSLDFNSNLIQPQDLDPLHSFPDATILVIRTKASDMDEFQDFSGTDPLALHPDTAERLHSEFPRIRLLVLDLPSADKENDGGQLLAHRNFFNLSANPTGDLKAIVELAYLPEITKEGYYYFITTPARIDTDAIISDLILYTLQR